WRGRRQAARTGPLGPEIDEDRQRDGAHDLADLLRPDVDRPPLCGEQCLAGAAASLRRELLRRHSILLPAFLTDSNHGTAFPDRFGPLRTVAFSPALSSIGPPSEHS